MLYCVDGISDDQEIANLFAEKFSNVYNCVSYDLGESEALYQEIGRDITLKYGNDIADRNKSELRVINVDWVSTAVGKLKAFKRDGIYNIFTNHIIHGTTKLYSIIADLFNAMIIHGFTPKEMLGGTIIPIPKQKGKTKSENYRSITLGTVLLKVFDIILLMMCNEQFNTSELQFGFKRKSSTTACSFAMQEVIAYYNENNSSVYSVLLDATKAYDRLEFCKLFQILEIVR